jgi:serine phosphatase RsbU (regulator of sigma subunit)
MSPQTGPGRLFVSASLWEAKGPSLRPLVSLGAPPELVPTSDRAREFVASASRSPTFVVTSIGARAGQRIAYAVALPDAPTFAVYAERAIPANRRAPVESNPAFADLNYATYLGPTTRLSALATTDLPLADLPLTGGTARDVIPFGNTALTLVASPRGPLGGTLGGALPWIVLVGGAVLTIATAAAARELVRRGRNAEQAAETIAGLYSRLDGLYGKQRTIAETLQRALLPQSNPDIPGLEIASRYIAGADGVEIGGDWYGCIALDDRHFGFVVGDVSGRGLSAATVMARLRFTIRAYLLEGHPPDVVLGMCSRQLDLDQDGHFSTALVGVGDLRSGEVTLASAGHPGPLVLSPSGPHYLDLGQGLPLGIEPSSYVSTSTFLAPGSTLLAFTDGLVERREESIEMGLRRLAEAATRPAGTLDDLISGLIDQLAESGAEDDIAVLALRWRGAQQTS